jgi:hypothetical protein
MIGLELNLSRFASRPESGLGCCGVLYGLFLVGPGQLLLANFPVPRVLQQFSTPTLEPALSSRCRRRQKRTTGASSGFMQDASGSPSMRLSGSPVWSPHQASINSCGFLPLSFRKASCAVADDRHEKQVNTRLDLERDAGVFFWLSTTSPSTSPITLAKPNDHRSSTRTPTIPNPSRRQPAGFRPTSTPSSTRKSTSSVGTRICTCSVKQTVRTTAGHSKSRCSGRGSWSGHPYRPEGRGAGVVSGISCGRRDGTCRRTTMEVIRPRTSRSLGVGYCRQAGYATAE